MSSLLRRSGQLARLSQISLTQASRRAPLAARRRTPLPQCIYYQQRARAFATQPPQDPKDTKEPAQKDVKDGQFFENKAPDAPKEQPQQQQQDSNMVKLTAEEEKYLDQAWGLYSKFMPKKMRESMQENFVDKIKKDGIPKQHHHELEKLRKGEASMADMKRIAESITNAALGEPPQPPKPSDQPQQKTGAHDPGPQNPKQEGQQGQQEEKAKFDINNLWRTSWNELMVLAFSLYLLMALFPAENSKDITWQEFRSTFLDKGLVEKVVIINNSRAKVFLHREAVAAMYPDSPAVSTSFHYYFTIGSVDSFESKMERAQDQLGIPAAERIPVSYQSEVSWSSMLLNIAPTVILIGGSIWLMRGITKGGGGAGGGVFGMGKSRAKKFNHETDVKVKFADVAGMDEAKVEIMEFVSFLKQPERFQRLGAKIPRGAILSGPPGTGKTLLAKATAGESGVPFFSVSGSEFVEMFVGVGASRVRDLFANARKSTPCIIFIDEIDAIGRSRTKSSYGGGNDEREATLNQILTEMDGFNTTEQVVVLAGTNRADVLDKALMRPGRFDRHISIDPPTMEGRGQIFGVHLQKIVTKEDIEFLKGRLASLTPGFSGADIANCVNEAALIAARHSAESVTLAHFEQAIERVIGGLEKKSLVLKPDEKRTVAYHEAGHAICGWYFKYADPLLKVSIIPRGQGALGYAQYLPAGETYLMNVQQLMDRMAMTLGGRVSEELHFETVTSGASDDFRKVTQMATAMVTKWGMTKKIGYIYFDEESQQSQFRKPYSEETAKNIDEEIKRIVDEAYKQCKELLTAKKVEVGLVAEELLKKEVLGRQDMIRLLGPRPFEDPENFHKYFDGSNGQAPGEIGEVKGEKGIKGPLVPPKDEPQGGAPALFKGLEGPRHHV